MTVPEPTLRIPVAFHGTGAGTDVLSWGQRELYSAMCRQKWWLPIGMAAPVPPGTSLDDILAEVRYGMARYPTMRTRLRTDPDGTRQVVAGRGEVTVEVFDIPDGTDAAAFAQRVHDRYWFGPHDHALDWPVRVGVVRQRGVPTHAVVIFSHLVTDGIGSIVLYREFVGRDRAADPAAVAPSPVPPSPVPPSPMPPLEQVAWQRSPAGRRQCASALAHWGRALRAIAARRFPEDGDSGTVTTGDPRSPRHWEAEFDSPALFLAAHALGARTGVDQSPLMLGVFAVALAEITGVNPVVVQVVVSNRFRPGLAATVSPVNQTGLCIVDVADITVEDAIRRAAKASLVAYKYAYYDPAALDSLVDDVARERGEELDIACFLNDRRAFDDGTARDPDGVPGPEQIRAAVPASEFRWGRRQDDPWERLFLHLQNVPGTARLLIQADTGYLSPDAMRALARGMESVAVRAALDPGAVTGIRSGT